MTDAAREASGQLMTPAPGFFGTGMVRQGQTRAARSMTTTAECRQTRRDGRETRRDEADGQTGETRPESRRDQTSYHAVPEMKPTRPGADD